MAPDQEMIQSVYDGWYAYQKTPIETLALLDLDQLELRAGPNLRTVGEIAAHIVGARARWFHSLMGEGGDKFKSIGRWDRRGAKLRSAEELVSALAETWEGMHEAIARWAPEDWGETWPGEDDTETEVITRHWVIWHLIEHDLHHGGEISITLGAHGVPALKL
jgi:uncharacterized damage-inducible protein DinB